MKVLDPPCTRRIDESIKHIIENRPQHRAVQIMSKSVFFTPAAKNATKNTWFMHSRTGTPTVGNSLEPSIRIRLGGLGGNIKGTFNAQSRYDMSVGDT